MKFKLKIIKMIIIILKITILFLFDFIIELNKKLLLLL